ncbi:cell division inhibitor SepF [Sporomusaceae bacterium BoRhaA]|jgi:cell division inhibitor SepF|uniref:cell division protein SepF n=1 Tax=Pelorhabdus rhamnosifermentans TaxID=2772457 RepID=UPI001C05FE99|nr:cell division protein SepF [Pelorhabdus rhamnosifermentans]MBU2700223.1 cell division inhibitor SepF [Pelorhabdus rhamnosifermentans]
MKLMEKVWGSLGLLEPVEDDERIKPEDFEPKNKKGVGTLIAGSNVVNLPTAQKQLKVMVVEPLSFDDAQNVAEYLKNRKPVVVNFEHCEDNLSKRMIDFISGTTYALNGSIQKIGNHIFLCAPNNVDVSFASRDDGEKTVLPWMK